MINQGVADSQQALGQMVGYNNASAFSQVINGKTSEPKEFTKKLQALLPDLNLDWLETGEGNMLITSGGQTFNGEISGNDHKFSGRDTVINPPCQCHFDRFLDALTEQQKLTAEAHAQTAKAQEQMDRLLSIIESYHKPVSAQV